MRSLSPGHLLITNDLVNKFSKCLNIPNFNSLLQELPIFSLKSHQIKLLYQPHDFYMELLKQTSRAKKRIVLASLYIGTGKLEKNLVSLINDQMVEQPNLKVKWLLDYTRASRDSVNSRSLLSPMVKDNSSSYKVSLYHTPSLRGLLKCLLPQRFNETIGLQHMKMYIFDDTTIISGANLSEDYFSNRQDRYVVINSALFAEFCEQLIDVVSSHSLLLTASNDIKMREGSTVHPFKGSYTDYCCSMKRSLENFWKSEIEKSRIRLSELANSSESLDTLILPTIQMATYGLRIDSDVTRRLIELAPQNSRLHLATGYFNLTTDYMTSILHKSRSSFTITCAHPKANGFLGAKGISGSIPSVYTNICKLFYDRIVSLTLKKRIAIREYIKEGWTYHAKGLWYFAPDENTPAFTLVGSPNFGYRSVNRDLESQIIIATRNQSLRQDLNKEQMRLTESSELVDDETFHHPDRFVPIWVKLFTIFMKKYF